MGTHFGTLAAVGRLDEYLALQAYVLEAAEAVGAAEQKLLTALGQATTLEDEERAETARQMLQEQALALRSAAEELSAWLDAPRT